MIGARAGSTIIDTDDGGVWRHFNYQAQGLESFAVAAVEAATGAPVDRSEFDPDGDWIDYAGPPETVRTYSFSSVLRGEVDPAAFKDKIVVVGAAAPSLQDVHSTSVGGGLMPGGEIQANAIATVLDNLPLRSSTARDRSPDRRVARLPRPRSPGLRVGPLATLAIAIASRALPGCRAARLRLRRRPARRLPAGRPARRRGRDARRPLPDRRLRAPARPRHVLSLRARGGRRSAARRRRRRSAARRRAARVHDAVHRHSRLHHLLGGRPPTR